MEETVNTYLGLIASVITIIGFTIPKLQTNKHASENTSTAPKLFRIRKIIQLTNNSNWPIIRIISVFVNILILGYGAVFTILLIEDIVSDRTQGISSLWIFVVLILIFSVWSLIDDYNTELRIRRRQGSKVFKWINIEIEADYNSLLLKCLQLLSDINTRITYYDANTGTFMAELPSNNIVLQINNLHDNVYNIYIASDSNKPTVKVDFGSNKKYVNECATRLLGYK